MNDPAATLLFSRRPVPRWVLGGSAAALALPAASALLLPELAGRAAPLWLLILIPVFLVARYRGARGIALALATGFAVFALAQAAAALLGSQTATGAETLPILTLMAGVALGTGWVAEMLHRDRARAEQLALTDELTHLPNRRHARMMLDAEFAAAQRGRGLVVVLFDLDHFKAYNDRHGHAAGDEALRVFGWVLHAATRRMNLSARLGGEEFLAILSDCTTDGALVFVERVRLRLEAEQPAAGRLGVSAGVAAFRGGMRSPEDLLAAADQALYCAKQDGRGCARVFEPHLHMRTV